MAEPLEAPRLAGLLEEPSGRDGGGACVREGWEPAHGSELEHLGQVGVLSAEDLGGPRTRSLLPGAREPHGEAELLPSAALERLGQADLLSTEDLGGPRTGLLPPEAREPP